MFYKWCEHKDGIFLRNYSEYKGYIVSDNTPCIKGKNSLEYPNVIFCPLNEDEVKYTELSWNKKDSKFCKEQESELQNKESI
jgi:hypothetical protein